MAFSIFSAARQLEKPCLISRGGRSAKASAEDKPAIAVLNNLRKKSSKSQKAHLRRWSADTFSMT